MSLTDQAIGSLMRGERIIPPTATAGLVALLTIVVAIPVTVVTGYIPGWMTRHRLIWIGSLILLALLVSALSAQSSRPKRRSAGLLQIPPVDGWIDRAELHELVQAVTAADAGPVALTTGLVGAGGFGKTTLAAKACWHRSVRRQFHDEIYWITLGRDLSEGPELAARISQMIGNIRGEVPRFDSPEQAGQALNNALASKHRKLLVLDDVWTVGQLAPFRAVTEYGRLLITTRNPALLAGINAKRITVDAVTGGFARQLLARDLPTLPSHLEDQMLVLTGQWPLLISLVNRRLSDEIRSGAAIDVAAADAIRRLRRGGPAALDITDSGVAIQPE